MQIAQREHARGDSTRLCARYCPRRAQIGCPTSSKSCQHLDRRRYRPHDPTVPDSTARREWRGLHAAPDLQRRLGRGPPGRATPRGQPGPPSPCWPAASTVHRRPVATGRPARPGLSTAAGRRGRLPARPGRAANMATAVAVNDPSGSWSGHRQDSRLVGRQKPNTVEWDRASWEARQHVGAGSCGSQGAELAQRKTALWPPSLINP